MFDTMTMTKIVGGLCGTFLVFLLGNLVAESLYHVGGESHAGAEAENAYVIEVAASGEAAAAEPTVDFAVVLASADAAKGEKVFAKCKACHKVDGSQATGPHLDGVVGRPVASVDGFGYSDGMKAHGGDWTPDALQVFLANPKGVVSGTKMGFAGLSKVEDRANVIAYLETLK